MTAVLTVPTHFGDLSELSQGLVDRVDEERIILYGPDPYDEGSTVGFAVLLVDGTTALEGLGRVAAAVDGGEARAPETRWDIVFDSLQLEGRSEVVYERIVLARQSLTGGDPATGEVSLDELQAQTAAEEAAAAAAAEEATADAGPEAEGAAFDEHAFEEHTAIAAAGYEADAYDEAAAADSIPPESIPPEASFEAQDDEIAVEAEGTFDSIPPGASADGTVDESFGVEADVDLDAGFEAPIEEAAEFDADIADDVADVAEDWDDPEEPFQEGATMVASIEDIEAPPGAPAPQLPDAPAGFQLQPTDGVLTRPMHPPAWWPEASPKPEPLPSTGYFAYEGGLPVPAEPPRPDLDPSLRVSPAPRPQEGQDAHAADPPAAQAHQPQDDAGYDDAPAFEEAPEFEEDLDVEADSFEDAPEAGGEESPETVEAQLDDFIEDGAEGEVEVGFDDGEEPAFEDFDAETRQVDMPEGGELPDPETL